MTQNELQQLLHYDPITGIFTWLDSGEKAGCVRKDTGYRVLTKDGTQYYAHRLAFLYMKGFLPEAVDHIDHDKDGNWWLNLRIANDEINSQNRPLPKNNTSGIHGVNWDKNTGKWHARISVKSKRIHLGLFTDKEDAITARKQAEIAHGFHVNHGT